MKRLFLAMSLLLFLAECNVPKPINGKIVGGAWITRGTGSSDLLRGLDVQLCKAMIDSSTSLRQYFADRYYEKLKANTLSLLRFWSAQAAVKEFASLARSYEIQRQTTDIDGKFQFTSVPQGSYVIFAQLSTNTSAVYWCIPVSITSSDPISVNIENGTAEDIINKR